eukprot:55427_1
MSIAVSPIFNPHKSIIRRTRNSNARCRTVSYQQRRPRQSLAAIQSSGTRLIPPTPCKTNYVSRKKRKIKYIPQSITPSPKKKRKVTSGSAQSLNKSDERWCKRRSHSEFPTFTNLGLIGVGSFSNVFKVQNQDSKDIFALKLSISLLNTREAVSEALNEVQIMNILQDDTIKDFGFESEKPEQKDTEFDAKDDTKHIIKLHDFWFSYEHQLHQIYDYYENGTLLDLVEYNSRLNYLQILQVMKQICTGLHTVHSKDIIHIDLKPENIYITQDYILKLGDFGISVNLQKNANCTPRSKAEYRVQCSGDPIYIAPELMNFDRTLTHNINTKTDIFSLGIILLELICDIKAPSQGPIFHNLRSNIIDFDMKDMTSPLKAPKSTVIKPKIHNEIDSEIKCLCRNMLRSQCDLRPNCAQILSIIADLTNNKRYTEYFAQSESLSGFNLPPKTIVKTESAKAKIKHISTFHQASPKCYDSLFEHDVINQAPPSPCTSSASNDPFRLNLNSVFENVSVSKDTSSPYH